MATFHHCGDFGDIIYCLPTMRALGGGTLMLGPAGHGTRLPMTLERYQTIRPLLEKQPYVEEVIFGTSKCDYDLNSFRFLHERADLNIAQRSLAAHNLPLTECDRAWLTVPQPIRLPGQPCVINRTWDRHHNALFCWPDILAKYGRQAVFVGLAQDYTGFCQAHRTPYEIPWYRCEDLLEFASIIAGAEMFIGNQSAGYAVCEALKMPAIVEVSGTMPNCIFNRPGVAYDPDPRIFAAASAATRMEKAPAETPAETPTDASGATPNEDCC